MEEEIKTLIENATNENNFHKVQRNGMFLSNNQIEILEKNNIMWNKFNRYRDLIYEIETRLNNKYDEDLYEILFWLDEQAYYHNTNK